MALRIPVGKEDFEEIRRGNSYYVDKTELIYDLVNGTDNKVTLFTRPRRFGKTLMMSMLRSFFDINRDSRDVFTGLSIMSHPEFCQEWMNRYPVLFLTLKGVEDLTFEEAFATLKVKLSELFAEHAYLLDSERTASGDKEAFQMLLGRTADQSTVKNSLKLLTRMMKEHFGKPVILLIDEYDVPLAKASEKEKANEENGYYARMLNIIRGMFDAALKTNEFLKFAVITGCLRIAKESIFSGTNNFKSYSVLDRMFSRYFGFTEEEVDKLLQETQLMDKVGLVKTWYNGYIFGNTAVFCPWDVVNYVADTIGGEVSPRNYWVNTSHNGILRSFVERTDFDVTGKFETLLNGGSIVQAISDELTYDVLHESEKNLWSVLLMTGYLTKADPKECGDTVTLKIPNEEISNIFRDAVLVYFQDTLDRTRQKDLMEALWNGEEKKASDLMTDILYDTISYFNYREDYYQAFLTGIASGLGYAVKSDAENGLGRTDITIEDKRNRRVMVLESKKASEEKELANMCEKAVHQIREKQYVKGFSQFKTVVAYGIAFYRKQALVLKYNE